jgi:uncharacterized protein (TIGR00255 family)
MTGHGQATSHFGEATIYIEVRSVNNRFLKVASKISPRLAPLDGRLEAIIREHVRRGTVNMTVRLSGKTSSDDCRLNRAAIASYAEQILDLAGSLQLDAGVSIGQLLMLPGVVDEASSSEDDEPLLEQAAKTVVKSLKSLNHMRELEGQAMKLELLANLVELERLAGSVAERAPNVVEDYRTRLQSRIEKALESLGVNLQPADILREVQLFADKCDIREELVRLESHARLFRDACESKESQGRKLDFLVQELHREVNTIGSKANDATITEQVVSMKTIVEQLREMVQNVE